MATGALNQLVAGLHSGFNAGMGYGEQIGEKMANRKVGKAEQELDQYLAYDPSQAKGAVDGEGNSGQPTLRDLHALRTEMREGARFANDPDYEDKADMRWAGRLKEGYNQYIDQARGFVQSGNHDAAARALEHAAGMMPNGQQYKVRRNKDGKLVAEGFDEFTGQPVEEKVMGEKELLRLKIMYDDPYKVLEILEAEGMKAYDRRQAGIDAALATKKRAEESAQARAELTKTESETVKNIADAGKSDKYQPYTGSGGYGGGLSTSQQNSLNAVINRHRAESMNDAESPWHGDGISNISALAASTLQLSPDTPMDIAVTDSRDAWAAYQRLVESGQRDHPLVQRVESILGPTPLGAIPQE